jgi:predicted transposase/invertase (TIGR01784 family)
MTDRAPPPRRRGACPGQCWASVLSDRGCRFTTGSCEDYQELRASVGLHLLDFDLFTATESQREQALWRFEMRDETQPQVSLGNILQMNLVELTKADRLGLSPGPLHAWIAFFKHWQEELTMASFTHEPVQQAMHRLRELSADEETRRLALVRERALHDEVSFLNEAKREGREEVARNLIAMNLLTDEQIATATGLTEAEVQALRVTTG